MWLLPIATNLCESLERWNWFQSGLHHIEWSASFVELMADASASLFNFTNLSDLTRELAYLCFLSFWSELSPWACKLAISYLFYDLRDWLLSTKCHFEWPPFVWCLMRFIPSFFVRPCHLLQSNKEALPVFFSTDIADVCHFQKKMQSPFRLRIMLLKAPVSCAFCCKGMQI